MLVEGEEAAAQQPPATVKRVVPVPSPTEGLLLPAAAHVIDRRLAEAHDVEGVQNPHRLRQAGA